MNYLANLIHIPEKMSKYIPCLYCFHPTAYVPWPELRPLGPMPTPYALLLNMMKRHTKGIYACSWFANPLSLFTRYTYVPLYADPYDNAYFEFAVTLTKDTFVFHTKQTQDGYGYTYEHFILHKGNPYYIGGFGETYSERLIHQVLYKKDQSLVQQFMYAWTTERKVRTPLSFSATPRIHPIPGPEWYLDKTKHPEGLPEYQESPELPFIGHFSRIELQRCY